MGPWLCLVRTQMAAENWGRAIVSLSRAERIARSLKDYAALGAVCNDMAGTYAATYSLPLAARKHYEAINAFTRAGDAAAVRSTLLAYGDDFFPRPRPVRRGFDGVPERTAAFRSRGGLPPFPRSAPASKRWRHGRGEGRNRIRTSPWSCSNAFPARSVRP